MELKNKYPQNKNPKKKRKSYMMAYNLSTWKAYDLLN